MSKQKKPSRNKAQKVWTVLCILIVLAGAYALRSMFVYRTYPLEHKELIQKYSEEYNIDKFIVCAVIKSESGFDENALSSPGAMGLMQIMPDTGGWAARKIGIEQFDTDMLFDPDINIRIGCWYLNYLNGLFDGDAKKVFAAYNAGPSRVNEWLDADGELREIPFAETEQYLRKIEKNYEIYKNLYKDF